MKLPDGSPRPTCDEQLAKWLAGEFVCPNTNNECCPDFSCCKPELQVSAPVRRAFIEGSPNQRHRWSMLFLGALVSSIKDKKVHAVGLDDLRKE